MSVEFGEPYYYLLYCILRSHTRPETERPRQSGNTHALLYKLLNNQSPRDLLYSGFLILFINLRG